MHKLITKIVGSLAAVLSLAALFLPIYRTYIEGGESWLVVLKGYNVVEFSAWGGLVVIVPLSILGIMYTSIKDNHKTILTIGIYMLGIVSLYNANYDTREWIYAQATGFVYSYPPLVYCGCLLFISVSAFYFHCNAKCKSCK